MPFYSIIIPTYNSEKTVAAALESVLQQRFSDFEVLIMDGLSSDRTVEIAQSFGDERIKIFSEKDGGVYEAMNKGIDRAQGEWLYFLGSDDTLYDDGVFARIYSDIKNNDTKIIYGNAFIIGNSQWASDGDIYDGEFDLKKILQKNICHQAIFYRKDIFQRYGKYNVRYKVTADYDFNLRLFSKEKFLYSNIIVANFEMGGLSSINADVFFRNEKRINILHYYRGVLMKKEFNNFYPDIKGYVVQLFNRGKPLAFYYFLILTLKKIQMYAK